MRLKNLQVIDGAKNSTFDIYQIPGHLFELVFPDETDIAFLDEVEARFKDSENALWELLYEHRIDKKEVNGIHGTLHLTGSSCSREFFPTRKESEVIRKGFLDK